jgi:hypothetical protein
MHLSLVWNPFNFLVGPDEFGWNLHSNVKFSISSLYNDKDKKN